jgi:hypothetical protein
VKCARCSQTSHVMHYMRHSVHDRIPYLLCEPCMIDTGYCVDCCSIINRAHSVMRENMYNIRCNLCCEVLLCFDNEWRTCEVCCAKA